MKTERSVEEQRKTSDDIDSLVSQMCDLRATFTNIVTNKDIPLNERWTLFLRYGSELGENIVGIPSLPADLESSIKNDPNNPRKYTLWDFYGFHDTLNLSIDEFFHIVKDICNFSEENADKVRECFLSQNAYRINND